ncbi:MAG: DegT/DnrJ/EryC1/StrS family aminotransferase [Elusimicrobia bacterium]|nr:DegT/DnrJ/EryC1/StrS family aminotransferase [Elusimicrobiota bacterium]
MIELIPFYRPVFEEAERGAVERVLSGGWPGMGPKVEEFERRFADRLGLPYAVAVSSGTAALHLALAALDIEGGEVATSSLAFVAVPQSIVLAGGSPIFCDVEPDTLNIDPESLRVALGPRVKAALVAHQGGHPADMEALLEVCRGAGGIPLVEDAAQACGAERKGRQAGTFGVMACFSFDPAKNMTCGEGGMVVTRSRELWQRLRELRWFGISKETAGPGHEALRGRSWYYNVERPGFKYLMSDINAALGLAQLERLDSMNRRREEIAAAYREGLEGIPGLSLPQARADTRCAWQRFVVQTDFREPLLDHLASRGIEAGVHYLPAHYYEPYRSGALRPMPVCERAWKRVLSLPIYPALTDSQAARVISAVREFFSSSR